MDPAPLAPFPFAQAQPWWWLPVPGFDLVRHAQLVQHLPGQVFVPGLGHVEDVRDLFLDALTGQDVLDLARIGEKVVGRLDKDHWILRETQPDQAT